METKKIMEKINEIKSKIKKPLPILRKKESTNKYNQN